MTNAPDGTITLRVNPVEILESFTAEMTRLSEVVDAAMREGRARDAVLAAGAMQSLLAAWKSRLADALTQTRSKRAPPAVRLAARAAAAQVLPMMRAQMRGLEARIKAHRARQTAISAALRAVSTPSPMTYGAGVGYGARAGNRAVPRALAVTV